MLTGLGKAISIFSNFDGRMVPLDISFAITKYK